MPILERTPPRKRQQDENDVGMESSPSRARYDRSVEKQANAASNGKDYVFPSLDAMAAPMRERNAAMTYSKSWTPTISTQANGSGRKEFGSLGSGSGRKLGSLNGRNAPIKTATAGSMYPSLGDTSIASSSRSPRGPHKRESLKPQQPTNALTSQEIPKVYPSIPESDIDDRPIKGIALHVDREVDEDRRAFEAQMEKALASGANPFQDRKRDQMRDDSGRRSVPTHQEETILNGNEQDSRRSTPRQEVLPTDSQAHYQEVAPLRDCSPAPSKLLTSPRISIAQPQTSPRATTTAQRQAEEIREMETTIAALERELASKQNAVIEMQRAAKVAQEKLMGQDKINKEQAGRLKSLENKIQQLMSAPQEQSLSDLTSNALSWELSRTNCRTDWDRFEKIRQRDIEAIIYRNEVTYMEARRAEAVLDIQMQLLEMEVVEAALRGQQKQTKVMRGTLSMLKKNKDELEDAYRHLEAQKEELEADFEAERLQREAAETGCGRLKEEIEAVKTRADQERKEHDRKERALAAKLKSSVDGPAQLIANKEAPSSPAKKRSAALAASGSASTSGKSSKAISEQPRQSPRKQVIEKAKAVVAKGVKRKSSTSIPSDQILEDNGEASMSFDANISDPRPVKAVTVVKKSTTKRIVEVPRSEEKDEPEEEMMMEEPVKKIVKGGVKKASLLDRGKAAAATKKGNTLKKREAELVPAEVETNTEQTPIVTNKRNTSRQKQTKALIQDDSFNVDATPVIQTKVKRVEKEETKQHQQSGSLSDDEEIENMTPVVPSKRGVTQESKPVRSDAPATTATSEAITTEVKKKKRRLLKPSTNIANGFLNMNGDGEGNLDPMLNLPLQISPIKGDVHPVSSSNILNRGLNRGNAGGSLTANASRLFGR